VVDTGASLFLENAYLGPLSTLSGTSTCPATCFHVFLTRISASAQLIQFNAPKRKTPTGILVPLALIMKAHQTNSYIDQTEA
jgi:hypothetical protein